VSDVQRAVRVGDAIPALRLPPLTRNDLERYAEASGDHAAVHLDESYARAMGFPGVIAHGLLVMAYLGRMLTSWRGVSRLQGFSCRFVAVALLGDCLECTGVVTALREEGGQRLADLDLEVRDQRSALKLSGRATVRL